MQKKIIIIDCVNVSKKDLHDFQTHLFDNGHQWHSSKYKGERKYKDRIDILIIEDKELFNGDESVIDSIKDEVDIIRFQNPFIYTRHFKIKKIKTKLN
jgi:hypothetical protein